MSDKIIDRETYRTIKKMSREELQAFLMRYGEGFREDAPLINLRELEQDIKSVKGIGEKRAEEIMQIIERRWECDYFETSSCKICSWSIIIHMAWLLKRRSRAH